MNCWLIESSFDGGKSWSLVQSYGIYKNANRAAQRVNRQMQFYSTLPESNIYSECKLRVVEYRRSK